MRYICFVGLWVVGTMASCVGEKAAPDVAATLLRCEYRTDPLGIDVERPRLSWVVESGRRGQVQTGYRVLVAGTKETLASDRGDLWDSGKVASDQSAQVDYGGPTLPSRQPCFWKVRVWDKDGKPSAWSPPARWSMGLLKAEDWKAKWIGAGRAPGAPLPLFRKAFRTAGPVRRATLYVTARGLFEASINGQRVGADFFMPGWTEYEKRLYYQTYDVTSLLRDGGENVIGAIVGDGWWGLHHGGRGRLALLAQLHVEYADGGENVIGTDESWKVAPGGPILSSDIFAGEAYDARAELPGWNAPGFDDAAWGRPTSKEPSPAWDVTAKVRAAVHDNALSIAASNATFGDPAFGLAKRLRVEYASGGRKGSQEAKEDDRLVIRGEGGPLEILSARYEPAGLASHGPAALSAYPGEPVRTTQEIEPKSVAQPRPGVYVFDMGQNFAGWARLKVAGPAGARVTLRFAEVLNGDGTIYTANLRGARCTDTYVLKGGGLEVWQPRFTYHGFRYVELTGCPEPPTKASLTGIVLHSDCPLTSTFECSNPMLNQLQQNIVWGQRSNYFEVPTDCPQRDERMGWSGDAQVFIGTGGYNMDVAAFFTSWLTTYNDTQGPDGAYRDVSPRGGGASPAWGDAGVICPWTIYRMYGDTRMLQRHWDGMTRWIAYLEHRSAGRLRPAEGFGDWLNLGAEMPHDVIATAYFAYSTSLMAKMARALDKPADAARFQTLLGEIQAAFNRAYVGKDGHIKGDTQTTYLMALRFNLLPEEVRPLAVARLVQLIDERRGHLSTGFLGVNLILPVLTEAGRLDLAYRLIQNEDYPSWGYAVKRGATTIWERWDGWTEKNGFQAPSMNSFNHYAYGACGQWMFSTMAGIDTDGPGFRRIRIRPQPGGGITWVKASYDSIRGRIATSWKLEEGRFLLEATIPANTTATLYVPTSDAASVTESGQPAAQAEGVRFLRAEPGAAVFEVGSGHYRFVAAPTTMAASPNQEPSRSFPVDMKSSGQRVCGNYELRAAIGGRPTHPCRIFFSCDQAHARHAFLDSTPEALSVGRRTDGRETVWRTFPGPGAPPWDIRLLKKGNFYTFSANKASGWIRGPMGEWENLFEPAESLVGLQPSDGAVLQACTVTTLPWLQQAGKPVIARGPARSYYECQAIPGAILEHRGHYYMYFMAGMAGEQEGASRRGIGLAVSDDLVTWQPAAAPVVRHTDLPFDNIYVNGATIAPDGRVALMFSVQQFPDWKGFFLATADAPEGPFRLHPGNPVYRYGGPAHEFDLVRVDRPEGRYLLFFAGFTPHPPSGPAGDRGYILFSDDLVAWRPHRANPVFSPQTLAGWDAVHVRPRSLTRIGGMWYLWYEGCNQWSPPGPPHHGWWDTVGLARSADLVHWEYYPRNPALPGLGISREQFDSNWTGWPRMFIRGQTAFVFYTGNGETGFRTIPVAQLTDWTGEGGQTLDLRR